VKKPKDQLCVHVERVAVHSSVVIGGVSIGSCQRKRLPGMTVCAWHADPDSVTMMMRELQDQVVKLRKVLANAFGD